MLLLPVISLKVYNSQLWFSCIFYFDAIIVFVKSIVRTIRIGMERSGEGGCYEKEHFNRTLTALCACMVMGACTGIIPVLAEDATEEDPAAEPADKIPSEEKDADQLTHEKALEKTASMELRKKIAQMIMVNIRYWSSTPEGEDDPEQTVESFDSERIKQIALNNE